MFSATINLYKNAFNGLTTRIWLLSVIMLVNRAGTMVLPFMTLYCTQARAFTYTQAGWAVGFYGLGSIVGALLGGKLTDKFGFYYIQFLSLFFGGVMFLVLSQMHNYTAFVICTFILSMVNEAFRPANTTAISHYSTPQNRTQSFSLIRLAINLGWGVGGGLGGFIASKNYQLLFWVDGVTNIVASILLLLILPKVIISKQHSTESNLVSSKPSTSPYRDKPFLYYIIFKVLFAICFFQLFTTLPLFLKEDLKLSESWYGFIMALNGILIALFEMIIVFKIEGKKPYLYLITLGTFIMACSYALLQLGYLNPYTISLLFVILMTVSEVIAMPFMNTWYIARSTNYNRGQYAAIYTMAWSVAQVIGSTTGTQIAHSIGFSNLWWGIVGLCIIATVGYYWLLQNEGKQ